MDHEQPGPGDGVMSAGASGPTSATPFLSGWTDEARHDAIGRRDPAADAFFVYSVRTTGIYCRPSCAARRALRENIVFHATCADAERAGFRACRRCGPDAPSREQRHADVVARACRLIDGAETTPSLQGLAATIGMSPHHFHRVFRATTGVTPKAYAQMRRAERVAARLPSAQSVTEALYEAGFNAASRFYAHSGQRLGMTPGTYRAGGPGMSIRFAVGPCTFGSVLAAATETGVCAILLGDDPDRLLRDLQDRFPRAELIGGDPAFEQTVALVVGLVEAPGQRVELPLDIAGTAFQQRVWTALRAIPAGRTASYAEVAQAIGMPAAVRAVARACGANMLAVAIPCHRVVRSDGSLSGYRWGIDRKRALLQREREPG